MVTSNKKIPRAKIQDGIDLCKKNIFDFLTGAESLLSANNLNYATVSVEFAIEEFAKILVLIDEQRKGFDPVEVPIWVFADHVRKSQRAWDISDPNALDSSYKMISNCGFERIYKKYCRDKTTGFSLGYELSIDMTHDVRLECIFVTFDEQSNQWFLGHENISKERIQKLIEHVRHKTAILT